MEFFVDIWGILLKFWDKLLIGVGNTMLIALVGTLIGLLIGLLTGVVRTMPTSKNAVVRVLQKIVNGIIAVYVEIFRGTPMMVQSMVIFWGYAFMAGGKTLPLIPAGIFIVSINQSEILSLS